MQLNHPYINASRFAIDGLLAMEAAGIFFNPFNLGESCRSLNPPQTGKLERFVDLCIELELIPNLRLDWEFPSPLPRICHLYQIPEWDIPEFLNYFKEVLQGMIGKDEFLGA